MSRQYCPAGQWTNASFVTGPFPFYYSLTCPVRADWRKYGFGSVPPYEQGSFIGTTNFWHQPFETVWIEVKPDIGVYVDATTPFG